MTDLDRALARLQDPCRTEIAADVAVVVAELERLREALNEYQLRSIEARNPGIDIDKVRASRQRLSETPAAPETGGES